jgi:malate synthase
MQLWQWVNHGVDIPGAGRMDRPLFHCHVQDALYQIQAEVGEEAFAEGRFLEAADLLETQILEWTPPAFLLPSACDLLAGPLAQVR